MFAAALSTFWHAPAREEKATTPPEKRPGPIFIGDAVQPWGRETLLLHILRCDASQKGADG